VAADGSLGGFSAPGGRETKRRLLALESTHADAGTLFAI
jgi:methylated-DNA-[protein]-cysteine S-methyltransferase